MTVRWTVRAVKETEPAGETESASGRPKIDKLLSKLVDFYFFTLNSSLFTFLSKLVD